MVKEHPPSEREIKNLINSQKGLSDEQKEILIRKSNETWFRQYVKNSDVHLRKLTKTVKKQIKEYYNKKGKREDKRGFEKPKKKGTTKPQLKKKLEEKKKPVKSVITKKGKLTRVEKEHKRRYDLALQTGKNYSKEEVREGINSKRSIAYRKRHNIIDRGKENEK